MHREPMFLILLLSPRFLEGRGEQDSCGDQAGAGAGSGGSVPSPSCRLHCSEGDRCRNGFPFPFLALGVLHLPPYTLGKGCGSKHRLQFGEREF